MRGVKSDFSNRRVGKGVALVEWGGIKGNTPRGLFLEGSSDSKEYGSLRERQIKRT